MVHSCAKCGASISPQEVYYREMFNDRFLQYLHSRALCKMCFETYGDKLLSWKGEKRNLFSSTDLRQEIQLLRSRVCCFLKAVVLEIASSMTLRRAEV